MKPSQDLVEFLKFAWQNTHAMVLLCFISANIQGQSSSIYEFDAGPLYFNTKNYFYDNGEEVVVFDTQLTPELARKSIAFIQSKTKNPIAWVVVLHPGIDKFGGMSAFQEIGAKVITSEATAVAMPDVFEFKKKFFLEGSGKSFGFTSYQWQQLTKPDSLFEGSHMLELKNGQKIILRELSNPGVSANHTVAYIAEEESIFVGDLVHYQTHANFEGMVVDNRAIPQVASWMANLNELNKIFRKDPGITIYGGRGKQTDLPTAVWDQTRYLKAAYPMIISYYTSNRRSWSANTIIPDRFYKEFQAQMELAFPGYELSYMTRTALWACWECEGAEKLK
jgi:glyoxylase-like metal-dependent hydrolase (beta-lactamase superfamily II)